MGSTVLVLCGYTQAMGCAGPLQGAGDAQDRHRVLGRCLQTWLRMENPQALTPKALFPRDVVLSSNSGDAG